MKFYFTIEETSIEEQERKKCSQLLSGLNHKNYYLGKYESRGYTTIVYEVDGINFEDKDKIDLIKNIIKNNSDVIQVSEYMKFYYKIGKTYLLKEINERVENFLENMEFVFKRYNSHSSNGVFFIGLDVVNINPLNENEINDFMNMIKKIEGVNEVIIY